MPRHARNILLALLAKKMLVKTSYFETAGQAIIACGFYKP
jgi:hypothetical protein